MKKAFLLAAVACVAMFALPAVASAGVWHVQDGDIAFTGTGGTGELTPTSGAPNVHCTSVTVNGKYETTTTGTVKFTFHGCTARITPSFTPACTTSGQSSGTITTTELTFHNVLLAGNKPGILVTPGPTGPEKPKDHFATFTCFGITTVVTGNGILGELNKNCGEESATATISFTSKEAGVQTHTQVTGAGTSYGLLSASSGGEPKPASEDASGTIEFAEGTPQKIDCTGV